MFSVSHPDLPASHPDLPASRLRRRWLPHVIVLLIATALLAAAPGQLRQREMARARESQQYLASIHLAQERYRLAHGRYADDISQLDLDRPEPIFFAIGPIVPGSSGDLRTSWSLTLTRFGETFLYGDYTVTFNERGFDPDRSSVEQAISPQHDPVAALAKFVVR